MLFLDTSALVKLYVQEEGSDRMVELAHPDTGHILTILALARVELRAAVRRRASMGDFDPSTADDLIALFEEHWQTVMLLQPVTDHVLETAARLIDTYTLRAYDAVQLAGGLAVRSNTSGEENVWFVTSDQDLIPPAQQEGFEVVNLEQ